VGKKLDLLSSFLSLLSAINHSATGNKSIVYKILSPAEKPPFRFPKTHKADGIAANRYLE
jgi:hypothetical protein